MKTTTLTTDDDGWGRHLTLESRQQMSSVAERVFLHKQFDSYKVALGILPWLWRYIRNYDLVHIHALFSFTSTQAGMIAKMKGVPYIVRPLGTLTDYGVNARRPLAKRLFIALIDGPVLRNAAAVHFTSEAERVEAEQRGIPLRSVVIPLGVEEPRISVSDSPTSRASRILFLSRLDPAKNVECLIRAFARLDDRHREARLVIAGGGADEYVESLRSLAFETGIADRVDWLGHVDDHAKADAFAHATLYVLPSHSESFGIAAVEAMLAGLPVVLSPGVGIAEEAEREGAAIISKTTPDALAFHIESLLQDLELRQRIGDRAREFASNRYSIGIMGQRLRALYHEILSHTRSA